MSFVLIVHEVESYPIWKPIFDRAANIRKAAGELTYQLLHEQHCKEKIIHFSSWSSLSAARDFFESPELVKLRKTAGVKAPEFIYLQEIERGVL